MLTMIEGRSFNYYTGWMFYAGMRSGDDCDHRIRSTEVSKSEQMSHEHCLRFLHGAGQPQV